MDEKGFANEWEEDNLKGEGISEKGFSMEWEEFEIFQEDVVLGDWWEGEQRWELGKEGEVGGGGRPLPLPQERQISGNQYTLHINILQTLLSTS